MYVLGQYEEAEKIFFELTQSDPQGESVLQAIYMRAFSLYMLVMLKRPWAVSALYC